MGKTLAKVKMWNVMDEDKVERGEVEPLEIEVQIDNGATTTVITQEVVEKLNLKKTGKTRVRYADERRAEREIVMGLRIAIMGRDSECRAILEPKRKMPLIGQIILEDLDLWIDSKNGRLIPNPESPDMPLLDEL